MSGLYRRKPAKYVLSKNCSLKEILKLEAANYSVMVQGLAAKELASFQTSY